MDRNYDYFLSIEKPEPETKAGIMSGNYPLDQQLIDLGGVFGGVEGAIYEQMKEKRGEANYKRFDTLIYERPKRTLHELVDQLDKLSRPRREWLQDLVWEIIFKEYIDVEEVKKLKESKWSVITHDVIRSL